MSDENMVAAKHYHENEDIVEKQRREELLRGLASC